MLYERTALYRKPDELAKKELTALRSTGHLSPALILKDPYVLDFLDLKDHYLERDFEDAILRELEMFLLELGSGFSSLLVKSVSRWMVRIFTLISCFIAGSFSVSSPSS